MRTRVGGAIGAIAAQLALLYVLMTGFAVSVAPAARSLVLFGIVPQPPAPPPTPMPRPKRSKPHAGAAAPPNLAAKPSEVVAARPVPAPQPVVAVPHPAAGPDASAGAAQRPGPGTGAGGPGNGSGSGGAGDGPGDDGAPMRWIKGEIRDSDYPRDALRRGIGGTVGLRFTVGVKGRVTDCTVTRSSGNADLNSTTCRVIRERFRYEPSRDARGRPVPDTVEGEHLWSVDRREGEE